MRLSPCLHIFLGGAALTEAAPKCGGRDMRTDNDFQPRLGRIRARGGKASKRYLARLYASMEKARPGVFARRGRTRFMGAQIGRGAGLGAAFIANGRALARHHMRRAAVKIRSVRLGASGLGKARAHLRYIQRDGAEKDGAPGKLYGPDRDQADGKAFLEEGRGDRHQFRIILSPEDAGELADLNGYTRAVMAAAERDLGTRLDWVAVNHHDTDHPHVHIVLRGRDDQGRDLVIARDYITHGFRKRAEEIATLELGPRRDLDIARSRHAEIDKERFTSLDRRLYTAAIDGVVAPSRGRTAYERFQTKLLLARLRTLEKMRLAAREKDGWRLAPDLEETLREAGRRGDIIRSMGAVMGLQFEPAKLREFGAAGSPPRLVGRVVGEGAADDAHDKRFLALEGVDGNQWHVAFDGAPGAAPPDGAIVEASLASAAPRKSDRTIAEIAARHDGIYSDGLHARHDPSASAEYRLAHKRRLEALRRAGVGERLADGTWRIPGDFLERTTQFEAAKAPARIRTLSWVGLDALTTAPARTFLDKAIEKGEDSHGALGFGSAVQRALATRRNWLLAQGLAQENENGLSIDQDKLAARAAAAMNAHAETLGHRLGKTFVPSDDGETVKGRFTERLDLPTGRFAVLEKSKEFTLVPWRPVMEARRGRLIEGLMERGRVNWNFGRTRSGPGR